VTYWTVAKKCLVTFPPPLFSYKDPHQPLPDLSVPFVVLKKENHS